MFGHRYFPARFFAPRYFPVGITQVSIVGTTGGVIEVRGGLTGVITRTASPPLVGHVGGIVYVRGGTTGAILPTKERIITVFIDGVDRTDYVGLPVTREMQTGGGSKATCSFPLVQKPIFFRPPDGAEVVIWHRDGYRWFAGLIGSTSEYDYTGSAALGTIRVGCVDYGALCDRVIVGREYQPFEGQLGSILVHNVTQEFLYKLGITYVYTGDPGVALGDQVYNWLTGTETLNKICQATNWEWRVDFYKNLYYYSATSGYLAAPFAIADDDENWKDMTVDRDSAKKRNRVGARNSANTKPLWTDTFEGDGSKRVFQTMSPLSAKPRIRVNGIPAVVVDFSEIGSRPYDWYWLAPASIVQNFAHAVLTSSDTITATYPSALDYVAWAEDAADIAANGLREGIVEVKDVATPEALQAVAVAELARKLVVPASANIDTDRDGLEPGMTLTVNTTRPLLNDTLHITKVTSTEQAKAFFSHSVTAVNTANQSISDDAAFFQKIIAGLAQPKDRVKEHIVFHVAETVDGFDNPGLTAGAKQAVRDSPCSGYLARATLYFKSCETSPTTSDISIDVLMDGVSIFGTTKMVFPAGATATQEQTEFSADPLEVLRGDKFTIEVLSADPLAMDGILEIELLVR